MAACVHAIVILPLTVHAMFAPHSWMPAWSAAAHGREMLAGFVLALIAGYLLGPQPKRWLCVLAIAWCLGRVAFLVPEFTLAKLGSPAFGLLMIFRVVPRLSVAKKWRNLALPVLLGLLSLAPLIFTALSEIDAFQALHATLRGTVLLLGLLLSFMGGRVLAPAFAGAHHRAGRVLEARVQPALEAGLILLIPAAVLLLPWRPELSGLLAVCAGMLVTIRLLRWRPWACAAHPDLIALSVGYAWVAVGLVGMGLALIAGKPATTALHVLTIGGIGLLSIGVMGRVLRARCDTGASLLPALMVASLLLSLARVFRVIQPFSIKVSFQIAAAMWSGAYGLMLSQLLLHEPFVVRALHRRRLCSRRA